jgi:hypothetical protein
METINIANVLLSDFSYTIAKSYQDALEQIFQQVLETAAS